MKQRREVRVSKGRMDIITTSIILKHWGGEDEMNTDDLINMTYDYLEGYEDLITYHQRHGTPSLLILTQHNPQIAIETARLLSPEIKDNIVIEIGAGVGFLAIEMAKYAKQVIAIESDPAWSWIFTKSLYAHKPPNLTWIFGNAESVIEFIRGDIVVIFTRSGINEMKKLAAKMAPKVIMPLQDFENFPDQTIPETVPTSLKSAPGGIR